MISDLRNNPWYEMKIGIEQNTSKKLCAQFIVITNFECEMDKCILYFFPLN